MTTQATRVTRPARSGRLAACALLAVLVGGSVAGCTDDDGGTGSAEPGGSSSSAQDPTPEVVTTTTVDGVSGRLEEKKRAKVKASVSEVIDTWFDGAFLGDFPRSDYTAAFAGFTEGAQANAMADLDLLTNQKISDRIDSATAVNKRVRLQLLAPDGRPRGATARFVLDFKTTGELAGPQRVTGALYLTKQLGEWHVFGYDVLERVAR